ncbi:MAG: molybdopterin converting factor subunit 1 [Betaproteobacteria bacterium]|nr:molybdopterin converting factor subunit 1 [Betaproteobacteria bacterium]
MLRVLYFASLREAFGMDREELALPQPATVAGLIALLRYRGGAWSERLAPEKRWRVAINHDMAGLDSAIANGDEIAIFPPVTGG